jgi:diguanylate cyclase (GGDEF)-like protein
MKRVLSALAKTYYELVKALVADCVGLAVLDKKSALQGSWGELPAQEFLDALKGSSPPTSGCGHAWSERACPGQIDLAWPLSDSSGRLLGTVCVALRVPCADPDSANSTQLSKRLLPVFECLQREFAAARRTALTINDLTHRSEDLQWLFELASRLPASDCTPESLDPWLSCVAARIGADVCAIVVPEQHLSVECCAFGENRAAQALREALEGLQARLLQWAHRHRKPLMMNRVGHQSSSVPRCKLLSVPLLRDAKHCLGLLVMLKSAGGSDFSDRHSFIATHIARQAAGFLAAQLDPSTGLYTRCALARVYESRFTGGAAGGHCVLLIDIDQLHIINEVHGYDRGDALIQRLARLLAPPLLPPAALTARLSGDRFIVVLPEMQAEAAAQIAGKLQQALREHETGIDATLSCGITQVAAPVANFKKALAAAETACQSAKEHGRNRIEIFGNDDSSIMQRHEDVFLVGTLRDAIKHDRFVLYAQPIIPLRDSELPHAYEILLRLRQPDGSISGPGEFLSTAQRYQLLPAIDLWVLEHTLELLTRHLSLIRSQRLTFSINLTGSSLGDEKFAAVLIQRLRRSRVPPAFINIEVTEQAAMRSEACAVRVMNDLRTLGCGVALDDFGTGTNSLTYLRDLPVTRVKIDGSFVRDIMENPRSEQTIRAIMQLLRNFPVETVAEYVETEAIARRLRAIGVDYAQGFAFGKPADLGMTLNRLQQEESQRLRAVALEF